MNSSAARTERSSRSIERAAPWSVRMMERTTSPANGNVMARRSRDTLEGSSRTWMRRGLILATPSRVATTWAQSLVMPSRIAGWAMIPSNISGLKAASCRSDARADISGGSTASMNGIPTIRNAASVF